MKTRARVDYKTPEEGIRRLASIINTLIDIIIGQSIITVTEAYTAEQYSIILADTSGGAFSISLPGATDYEMNYNVKKIDSSTNALTIDPQGTETIDGHATVSTTAQFDCFSIISDGSNWLIV